MTSAENFLVDSEDHICAARDRLLAGLALIERSGHAQDEGISAALRQVDDALDEVRALHALFDIAFKDSFQLSNSTVS